MAEVNYGNKIEIKKVVMFICEYRITLALMSK